MTTLAGTVTVADAPVPERVQHLALLFALSCLLFFLGLGNVGLTDQDEGRNSEAGREMLETGNWISPTFNYEPRFDKPVFLYWLMSGAYSVLGVSEFSARFPSALFGVGVILLQYLFFSRVAPPTLALLCSLTLLLNLEIIAIGRLAITDSVLIFFTTLALFCFWVGLHGQCRERHALWGLYVGMSIATLTKGPVGFLVPLLAIVTYLSLTHRWGQFWKKGFPVAGTLVFILLTAPWYAAMLSIHGSAYTDSASAHTIGRYLTILEGHGGTFFFYFPVLIFGFFPWSGFLPVGLRQVYQFWRDKKDKWKKFGYDATPSPMELELFAAGWLVVGFIFFTVSATRLPHYIGPLFPAAAFLAASSLHRAVTEANTPGVRFSFRAIMIIGYLLGLLFASGPALYSTFIGQVVKEFPGADQVDPGLSLVAIGMVFIVGSGMIGYFGLSRDRRSVAIGAAGLTMGLVMVMSIQLVLPTLDRYFIAPPQELAYVAGANLGPEDRFIMYARRPKASVVFYSKRKVLFFKKGQEDQIIPHLAGPGQTMILLPAHLRSRLPTETEEFPVLLRRHGYMLLGNKPMVEIPLSATPKKIPPPSFH